jgi:CRP-like cAMP-binding protein
MVPPEMLESGFLEGFPPEHLAPLAAVAKVIEVKRDDVIFQEGQKSPNIYLVAEGKVALEVWATGRGTICIQTVGPGRLLGWSPLLGGDSMTATARALEPTRLVALNAMQVLAACAQNTAFGVEFMRRTALALSRRLKATRLQLLEVCQEGMPVLSE